MVTATMLTVTEACALLATMIAVGAVAVHVQVDPSRVVTAGTIMLRAGIGFPGAMNTH